MTTPGLPQKGDVIAGKLQVEDVLGAGGMGVVVAARHLVLRQRVAVKFLLPHASRQPEATARFVREAQAAVAIQSEHVARVLDVGTMADGAPYMVMEFLAGTDLGKLLKRSGPPPIADAVDYVLQAGEAIAEAHTLGIVHRDLKPGNLFLTSRPEGTPLVKVLDFGLSKMTLGDDAVPETSLTASHVVMGSPHYMSPEQVRSLKYVDWRTDVWALGVILYELLTGRRPFTGTSLPAVSASIVLDTPKPLRSLRPDAPPGLEAAVLACLAKDREHRTQSVAALAQAIAPFAPARAWGSVERIVRLATAGAAGAGPVPVHGPDPAGPPSRLGPEEALVTLPITAPVEVGRPLSMSSGVMPPPPVPTASGPAIDAPTGPRVIVAAGMEAAPARAPMASRSAAEMSPMPAESGPLPSLSVAEAVSAAAGQVAANTEASWGQTQPGAKRGKAAWVAALVGFGVVTVVGVAALALRGSAGKASATMASAAPLETASATATPTAAATVTPTVTVAATTAAPTATAESGPDDGADGVGDRISDRDDGGDRDGDRESRCPEGAEAARQRTRQPQLAAPSRARLRWSAGVSPADRRPPAGTYEGRRSLPIASQGQRDAGAPCPLPRKAGETPALLAHCLARPPRRRRSLPIASQGRRDAGGPPPRRRRSSRRPRPCRRDGGAPCLASGTLARRSLGCVLADSCSRPCSRSRSRRRRWPSRAARRPARTSSSSRAARP
ncbi:MAG: protein kinase [Minicystis sp.]